jgi:hypothetical protein
MSKLFINNYGICLLNANNELSFLLKIGENKIGVSMIG